MLYITQTSDIDHHFGAPEDGRFYKKKENAIGASVVKTIYFNFQNILTYYNNPKSKHFS